MPLFVQNALTEVGPIGDQRIAAHVHQDINQTVEKVDVLHVCQAFILGMEIHAYHVDQDIIPTKKEPFLVLFACQEVIVTEKHNQHVHLVEKEHTIRNKAHQVVLIALNVQQGIIVQRIRQFFPFHVKKDTNVQRGRETKFHVLHCTSHLHLQVIVLRALYFTF
jgi:hypothetical protein